MKYNHITELIGNTPLLLIDPKVHGLKNIELYAKLEYYNPFGSLKDRVANGMLQPVLNELIDKKMSVVESSSGNTAKALAVLCQIHNIPFTTITNRIKVPELRAQLQIIGAKIQELPGISECPDPNDPNDPITVARTLANTNETIHYTDQYFSEYNVKSHYETTGKEIHTDIGKVDFFIGFLGTCGSTLGAGKYLKEHNASTKIIGVVSAIGNYLPGGRNKGELWETGFFKNEIYDQLIEGTVHEGLEGMRELNQQTGILCGPTGGLSYAAAKKYLLTVDEQRPDGQKKIAVFIACDRFEQYTSYVKQYKPEWFASSNTFITTVNGQSKEELMEAREMPAHELISTNAIIIDIRSNIAYRLGHISGSINIPDDLLTQMMEAGPTFPKQKIVIVCAVGIISRKFAAFLNGQGYEAASLQGGLTKWKTLGHSLEA